MDILRLVRYEGSESVCGSIPEAVSLKSDDSSTNSELSDGFGAKPLTVSYGSHDRKRVQRNYFHLSDAVLDAFDALQYNFCGFDEDTSTMLDFDVQHRGDHKSAFETKHSPDRVSVVVEVSRQLFFSDFKRPNRVSKANLSVHSSQATAITYMDDDFARGESCLEEDVPFVLGSHFVGVVRYCGSEAEKYGIRKGMRVASIVKWRSGSKSLTVPASNLAIVPNQLDAGDVATLVAVYLPAFQALYHGQGRRIRYSRQALKGRTVLVTGGGNLVGQAVIRLARWAGADVFATAQRAHVPLLSKLSSVKILDGTPSKWLPRVKGKIDVVVDFEFPRHLQALNEAVGPGGRLVCVSRKSHSAEKSGWIEGLEDIYENYRLTWINHASLYNFEENFENVPELARRDLKFLMKLLTTRQIRPQIDRYIHFKDVANIREDLTENRPLNGAIVCEP
jgi:NADPH:quinone reductase-like Zn-dependent oxidoreductase